MSQNVSKCLKMSQNVSIETFSPYYSCRLPWYLLSKSQNVGGALAPQAPLPTRALFSSLNINTYTVTLKIRSKRNARRTDSPKDPDLGLKWVQTTSKTLAEMTRQSKRLNDDSKYILGPRAHIRNSISKINSPRKKNSAMSVK